MKKLLQILILIVFYISTFADTLKVINNFSPTLYLGKWYEIARLPNSFEKHCKPPIIAQYSIESNNLSKINVINQCMTNTNSMNIANGTAYYVESQSIGKLKVTFLPKYLRFLPFIYGDYWILYVNYSKLALVGSPDHEYLWILSRTIKPNSKELKIALQIAQEQGFDINKLIYNY